MTMAGLGETVMVISGPAVRVMLRVRVKPPSPTINSPLPATVPAVQVLNARPNESVGLNGVMLPSVVGERKPLNVTFEMGSVLLKTVTVIRAVETPSAVRAGGLTSMLMLSMFAAPRACVGLAPTINRAAPKRPASAETKSSVNLLIARLEIDEFIVLPQILGKEFMGRILVLCILHTLWYILALNIHFYNYKSRSFLDKASSLAQVWA